MSNGSVCAHNNAALNLLSIIRISVVQGGMPVDIRYRSDRVNLKAADRYRVSQRLESCSQRVKSTTLERNSFVPFNYSVALFILRGFSWDVVMCSHLYAR